MVSFVGTRLLFLGGRLLFVGGVLSFVHGGLICGQCTSSVGGGLMFVGADRLVGGGCHSGMGGRRFVMLLSCCIVMSPYEFTSKTHSLSTEDLGKFFIH